MGKRNAMGIGEGNVIEMGGGNDMGLVSAMLFEWREKCCQNMDDNDLGIWKGNYIGMGEGI